VSRVLPAADWIRAEELLVPAASGDDAGELARARRRRDDDVAALDPGVRRLVNPHVYHVSVTEELHRSKQALLAGLG
jgi:nicotinate phosphoribosyltransferase